MAEAKPVPCFGCLGKKTILLRPSDDLPPERRPCPVCGATGDLATVSPIDIQKKAATEGISVEALIARLRGHHEVLKVEKCVNCNGTGKNSLLGGFRGESRCETCSGLGHVAPPELDEDSLDEVERLFDA